jgi:hypothetical protein
LPIQFAFVSKQVAKAQAFILSVLPPWLPEKEVIFLLGGINARINN